MLSNMEIEKILMLHKTLISIWSVLNLAVFLRTKWWELRKISSRHTHISSFLI